MRTTALVANAWSIAISLCLLCVSSAFAQDSLSTTITYPWAQAQQLGSRTASNVFTAHNKESISYPKTTQPISQWKPYNEHGLWGFKHQNGIDQIPAGYEAVGEFTDSIAWVKMDHKRYYYINQSGNPIVNFTFDRCFNPYEGRARVHDMDVGNNGFGYLDLTGEVIIPLQFKKAMDFVGGHALVQDWDGCWWLINSNGEKIGSCTDELVEQNGIFWIR